MRLQLLVCLLLVTSVSAQTAQPPAPAPPLKAAENAAQQPGGAGASSLEAPKLNDNDAVITIKGFCSDSSLQADACKTVITKAQFDKLAETLQPGMPAPMRRQLANTYAQVLTMSAEAQKRGLDKTPHFEEYMRYVRMQVLSGELRRSLQTDSNNISDADIQDYYQKNARNFEQASLIKIFVPHTKREAPPAAKAGAPAADAKPAANQPTPEEKEKAGVEAMKQEASTLREDLVKGEDPDKLQKEAFVSAGLLGTPPPTKMDKVRRPGLAADQQLVMELKPGDVSEVISDPSGNFIYKMVSKEAMPLDSVKTEIHNQLSSQRYRDTMQHYQGGVELNDAYFGPSRMPAPPRKPAPDAPKVDPD